MTWDSVLEEEEDWKAKPQSHEVECTGCFGEQKVIPSIHGGQLIIGSRHVSFHSTKIMFSHRPAMENENNVG